MSELTPQHVLADLSAAPTFQRRSLTPNERPRSSFSGCSTPGLRSSRPAINPAIGNPIAEGPPRAPAFTRS
jgi:hypothetical protein